ncbi:MAG: glycoside hydrolase family 20 zincin-like fold domain-containing protein, partial [Planctomycetota bacterium]|nr:glycoside hydrolase family 20 zincin-like fold domain-containing protein [Planctomycetota bacterium]
DTDQEYFPNELPRRPIPVDAKGKGKPEKEVQTGWVPFSKGSLTEGRGKDDINEISYCTSKMGQELPEGIDIVFDFKKNYFIEMLELFPMTSGLSGIDIYVRPEGANKDYLIWKMNGAGVLNPVREMMVAKVRGLDSVGRYVRLTVGNNEKLNVKEIRIWGRPQGSHKDTEIRHFRWKDGIVMAKKEFTQMKRTEKPFILPLPRELEFEEGKFEFKTDQPIVHADNDQDRRTAEILAKDLLPYGIKPQLFADNKSTGAPEGVIWIGTSPTSKLIAAELENFAVKVTPETPGPEGYALVVRPGVAILAGSDPAGTVYARDSFMQLLEGSRSSGIEVPAITIRDWPNVRIRSLNMLYVGGLQTGKETDESIERFIRILCRYRYNTIYLSGIPAPGRRRLAADFNITIVSGAGSGGGGGAAAEFATDETYAHVTSEKFDFGSRVNANPAHPVIYYNFQNSIYDLTQNPLSRFNHIGHDEMTWVTSGSRWNESRLSQLRNMSGGDLFAEMILREHDMLKRVRRDTITLNTVLTTHGATDQDEYAQMNRAYPLIARDIAIDNYHSGSGKFSDPFYSNTAGFERTIYIWRRPKPGELWNNPGVTGYWMANWGAFSLDELIREFYGNSSYWASRGVVESQLSWNPYDDLVKAQPDRADLKIGDHDDLIALSSIRTTELLAGYRYPVWRKETKKNYRTLDLRSLANWSHIDEKLLDGRGWVDKGTNYDLSRLPTGRVEFCQVPFEILSPKTNNGNSVVLLQNRREADGGWPGALQKVTIPVGASVGSLTIIRTTMEGGGPPPKYEATYEDGGYTPIPMVYLGWNGGGKLRSATRQSVWPAWIGDAPCGDPLILYACEWVNPHPEKAVREITIRFSEPGSHRYSEAVFSITALETTPTDIIEWESKPGRPPILTLARPYIDDLPSFDEKVAYGQSFSFPHGKPIIKTLSGRSDIESTS